MLPEELLRLARHFEGLRLVPYLCPAGVPTIGYGHTGKEVSAMGRIDQETAEAFLYIDMARSFVGAGKASPVLWTDELKHAAIADFCFNLGVGPRATE
uniref:Lysozyme n=1 Tax=Candidatus Kentrum eta TaxID=2126337 RepID=A0A450VJB5_9GAMM|nr:MAG: hypothetical protein BECKH772A_GA0070896_104581 [Candidatus Kentron sp. H]VFK04845.1 MAG: hypothetical protein BECKH772B_GA0070898_104961 [Candidatus Kentron sp. H]VFK08088.1 MAG: hypothetical protein BECKH772C_GA0070978_104861 [Candidatus Kentron sp. H]